MLSSTVVDKTSTKLMRTPSTSLKNIYPSKLNRTIELLRNNSRGKDIDVLAKPTKKVG
jgi:hypothetical protein